MDDRLYCIVAAAGMGKRAQLGYNKNYASLCGIPVLIRNLSQLSRVPGLGTVVVAVAPQELEAARELLRKWQESAFPGLDWQVVAGGRERQDSVASALAALPPNAHWVAVHDGARPFAGPELFERVLKAARKSGAAIAAVPCKDTIKSSDNGHDVEKTLERSRLWAVQTPQVFARDVLEKAFSQAASCHLSVTDDASMVEAMGHPVTLVEGSYRNFKITTPDDFVRAEALLTSEKGCGKMEFHVGSGYDVHRLVENRPLILCGVTIPYEKGLDGHSDADVALHALMDAILGAAGMGDIGRLFPDTDAAYLGADSRKLLREVLSRIARKGWHVHNADVTIIAQRPKLLPYEPQMLENLREDLGLSGDAVNIKATTTEKLGFTGRGEGIAAEAVVLLQK